MAKNCSIFLNIGTEEIQVSIPSDRLPSSQEELITYLISNDKWGDIQKAVNARLKNRSEKTKFEGYRYDSYYENDVLITPYATPNLNGEELKLLYPTLNFPSSNLSKYKIQLVHRYAKLDKGYSLVGIALDINGNDVLLVDESEESLRKLSSYFTLRTKIEEDGILEKIANDENDENSLWIKALLSAANDKDTIVDLVIMFLNNKSAFRGSGDNKYFRSKDTISITYKDSKGKEHTEYKTFFRALDDLCSSLIDGYLDVIKFDNPIINTLNETMSFLSGGKIGTIKKMDFLDIVISNGRTNVSFSDDELFKNLSTLFGCSEEIVRKVFDEYKEKRGKNATNVRFVADLFDEDINSSIEKLSILFSDFLKRNINKYVRKDFNPDKEISPDNKKYKGTGWEVLFDFLHLKEPKFSKVLYKAQGLNLYFKSFFPTLLSAYGYGFDDVIKLEDPIYYKGFYIQKIGNHWFALDYYTTENQRAVRFNTEEEAKNYIINRNPSIYKNSYITLNLRKQNKETGELYSDDDNELSVKLPKSISRQTILTVPKYYVPDVTNFVKGSLWGNFLYGDLTLLDFYQFILSPENEIFKFFSEEQKTSIIERLDSPLKVALFISQLFNQRIIKYSDRNTLSRFVFDTKKHIQENIDKIIEISKDIEKAPLLYYYILSIDKENVAYVVPIRNRKSIEEYKGGNRSYPVTSLWNAAAESLRNKGIDIPVKIITLEDINNYNEEKEESQKIQSNASAFISSHEGEPAIYINATRARSTDLYHEYTHLILGMLKLRNYDAYISLLEKVWNIGVKNKDTLDIVNRYAKYPRETIMEEYFVKKFTDVVLKNKGKLSDFLSPELADTYKLFTPNTKGPDIAINILSMIDMKIQDVFTNFNHDIAMYLSLNKTLFGDTKEKDLETLKVDRKKINWIRQLIKDGTLIEDCL